jgi:hypothetical protein
MSMANAPRERLEQVLERIASTGEYEPPDELDDLQSGIPMFTQAYHKAGLEGKPEAVRDAIRQWIGQASAMLAAKSPPGPSPEPPSSTQGSPVGQANGGQPPDAGSAPGPSGGPTG